MQKKPKQQLTDKEIQSALESSLVSFEEELVEPPAIMKVGNVPIFTRGNISVIKGKAKSRKTFLISSIVAAYYGNKWLNFRCDTNDRGVIWIDTEQGKIHVWKALKRSLKMSKVDCTPKNMKTFYWRKYSSSVRLELMEYVCNNFDFDLLIIDGVRDLVSSVNDEEQCNNVVSKLMRLSEEKDMHIANVLHENKSNSFMRGHIGTEMENKSETVMAVESKGEMSVVSCERSRDKAFEPFGFFVDDRGFTQLCDIEEEEGSEQKKKSDEDWKDLFDEKAHLKYCEIMLSANLSTTLEMKKSLAQLYNISFSKVKRPKTGLWSFLIYNGYIQQSNLDDDWSKGLKFGDITIPF